MKLKQYPEYKELELPWIDRVPLDWDVLRAKCLFNQIDIRSEDGEEELLSVSEKQGVTPRKNVNVTMFKAESYKGYKLCWPGDLVINSLWAWMQGLGFSRYHGIISTAYGVYRIKNEFQVDYKYFDYLFRSAAYLWELRVRSKGIWRSRYQLTDDAFMTMPVIVPPESEQRQIVKYLDSKSAQITKFIRNKRQLIQLLKEQKQAIINQAVTRGLDPNVKIKPSGVNWLGDIPEHWNIVPLRSLGKFQNGISESAEYFGSGYPFISYGDIYSNMVLPLNVDGLANSSDEERKRLSVEKGDVFFTRTSETIEEIGISSVCMENVKDAVFSGFIIRFRPTKIVLTKEFSKYYFRSYITREFFVKEMNIVTRASLAQDLLKRLPVLLPPSSEQKEIFDFLEKASMRIDLAVEKAQREINLIQEYRTRLISDVVTGKVDVRNIKVEDVGDEELLDNLSDTEDPPACADLSAVSTAQAGASAGREEVFEGIEVEQ